MQAITLSTSMNPFCNVKFSNQERLGRNALAECYRERPMGFLSLLKLQPNQPERRVSKGLHAVIGFVPQTAVFVFAAGFTGAKIP